MDEVWKRNEIESPCQKICVMHRASDLCIGCLRTRPEIARWSQMTVQERHAIMDELPSRAPRLKGERRGRAARRRETGNSRDN